MSKEHLIDTAYEVARKKFKTKPFTFRELFKATSNSTDKSDMSDLYVDLISDIRFIYIGKEKWTLTENLKNDDFQKISSSMFGLDKYTIEDLDDYEEENPINKEDKDEDSEIIIDDSVDGEYDSDIIDDSNDDDITDESDNIINDIEDLDDDIDDLDE